MSFPIFIRHIDGELRSIDVPIDSICETVKDLLEEENGSFDLVYAGDVLEKKQKIEPNMEIEMVVNRDFLAEKRVDEIFEYSGSSFWEQNGALTKDKILSSQLMSFPPPTNIDINMMPFIVGDPNSLPEQYHGYSQLIDSCWGIRRGELCYLTIQESMVKKNDSQRRPGLHIETPGNSDNLHPVHRLGKGFNARIFWGEGIMRHSCRGGIYTASTVADSCKFYNCRVKEDQLSVPGVVGKHGDISHLHREVELACRNRKEQVESIENHIVTMQPNTMYWFTDRTPHESLPLKEDTYRQFFRVVTSNISVWFEDHSTKNPLGITPPESVTILKGDKFSGVI